MLDNQIKLQQLINQFSPIFFFPSPLSSIQSSRSNSISLFCLLLPFLYLYSSVYFPFPQQKKEEEKALIFKFYSISSSSFLLILPFFLFPFLSQRLWIGKKKKSFLSSAIFCGEALGLKTSNFLSFLECFSIKN